MKNEIKVNNKTFEFNIPNLLDESVIKVLND